MNWVKHYSREAASTTTLRKIQEHLEEKDRRAGCWRDVRKEGAYAARREFGNVMLTEKTAAKVWRWPSIEDFFMDVRFGARMLRKNPGLL